MLIILLLTELNCLPHTLGANFFHLTRLWFKKTILKYKKSQLSMFCVIQTYKDGITVFYMGLV